MIIDAHCHVFWHGHDDHRTVRNMDQYGIDKAWLLTWDAPADEYDPVYHSILNPTTTGMPLQDVITAVNHYPDRFVPGYAPDPRRPNACDLLRAAREVHGVRVCGEVKARVCYGSPDAITLFHQCAELRMPVVFHLNVILPGNKPQTSRQWWYGGDIGSIERMLQQCPETVFIGHAPGFWREISGDADDHAELYPKDRPVTPGGRLLRLMDAYPNLCCDISARSGLYALQRDLKVATDFLTRYQNRVLYGRDLWENVHLEFLRSLNLPSAVFAKITSGNALRLVPL
jgi:predicted TIM-barrel fold metal-dependent hydrolase